MLRLGTTELIIIFAIIILLFGVGRIGKIGSELGTGIKAFKDSLGGDKKEEEEEQKAQLEENKTDA